MLLIPAIAGCQLAQPVRTLRPPGRQATSVIKREHWASETDPSDLENTANTLQLPASVSTEKSPVDLKRIRPTQYAQIDPLPLPAIEVPKLSTKQHSLTLADLEGIAFGNNPTLAAAAARRNAAQGRHVQAGLPPNPVIGYHATEVGNLGTAGQQGGFISQRFITGGKLRWDQAIAQRQIIEARFQLRAQEQRVLSDVRSRFHDALVAERRRELSQELDELARQLVDSTTKLLDVRQVSRNDLLQAEIEAERAQINHENAGDEQVESWRRLTAVLGVPTMEPQSLAGELAADIPLYSWEECNATAVEQSPELAAAVARLDRARFAVERARRENIPDVDVAVSVRHHNVTHSDVANIQVGIPIPILNKNQGNILRAQAELAAAHNEIRRVELDLQDRLAVAYRRYVNARRQTARYAEQILPRAKRSLELVSDAYGEGQVDFLTRINSQRTFIGVNLAYLDSLKDLWASVALIEGQLLSNSLANRQ